MPSVRLVNSMILAVYRRRWPTDAAAAAHFERLRWGRELKCPYCGDPRVHWHASKDKRLPRRQCQRCKKAFSSTVATAFQGSHLPIRAWVLALASIQQDKHSLSIAELSRQISLPYKTTWILVAKLRKMLASQESDLRLLNTMLKEADSHHIARHQEGTLSFGVFENVASSAVKVGKE